MQKNTLFKMIIYLFTILIFNSCTEEVVTWNPPTQTVRELKEIETDYSNSVSVQNNVFTVLYSEIYQQPIELTYTSTDRPKNVDRDDGGYNWFTEEGIITSDNNDYYDNPWDRGHIAPAATYSDSQENLLQTFSFLNCALQKDNLNRGEWRELEEMERVWDDTENLIIDVTIKFSDSVLPTGARIPFSFRKCITFVDQGNTRCFEFPNKDTNKNWTEYEVIN